MDNQCVGDPYVVARPDGSLVVRMRPGDTQGNFTTKEWEAMLIGGIVLIQCNTYNGWRTFELPTTTPLRQDGVPDQTVAALDGYTCITWASRPASS